MTVAEFEAGREEWLATAKLVGDPERQRSWLGTQKDEGELFDHEHNIHTCDLNCTEYVRRSTDWGRFDFKKGRGYFR